MEEKYKNEVQALEKPIVDMLRQLKRRIDYDRRTGTPTKEILDDLYDSLELRLEIYAKENK